MRATRLSPQEDVLSRTVPPYHVLIENDDYHSTTFVVTVLCKALGHSVERAYELMLQAHHQGRAIVWTAPKEVAELKVEQITTFREDPYGPLGCSIEPAG